MSFAAREGHEIRWFVGKRGGRSLLRSRCIDLHQLPGGERIPELAAAEASSSGIERLARELRWADVVHVQNVMNPTLLKAAVATGRCIVTVQDHRMSCPGPGRTLPDGTECRAAPDATVCRTCLPESAERTRRLDWVRARSEALRGARLLVLSHWMREELGRVGLSGVEVLPPWLEVDPRDPVVGRGFVLAGRLVAHKNPALAWTAWERSGVGGEHPLRIAGSGPVTPPDDVEALGWTGRAALRETLRESRALLFPTRWQEPLGIVGIEALAVGTPVVAVSSGGMGEWAARGCRVVKAGDVEGFAAAIRDLAERPGEAIALGREGRRHVAEKYSPRRWQERLLDLYSTVAGSMRLDEL